MSNTCLFLNHVYSLGKTDNGENGNELGYLLIFWAMESTLTPYWGGP